MEYQPIRDLVKGGEQVEVVWCRDGRNHRGFVDECFDVLKAFEVVCDGQVHPVSSSEVVGLRIGGPSLWLRT